MRSRTIARGIVISSTALLLTSCINFEPVETFSASASGTAYAIEVTGADVTGDGTADALVETFAETIRVDICGEGCFERREALPGVRIHATGDFDGDEITDVHAGGRLYFGGAASDTRPAGLTIDDSVVLPAFATPVIDVGDLDGDGDLDLLTTKPTAGGLYLKYVAVLGDGAGGFTAGPDLAQSTPLNEGPPYALLGDVDGDGCDDLFSYRWSSVAVYPCSGPDFTASGAGGPFPYSFAGDIDGDGRDDIAMVSGSTVGVLRSTGTSYVPFPPHQPIALPNPQTTQLALRELDGDGRVDLIVEDNVAAGRWFSGAGDGSFPVGALSSPQIGWMPEDEAFGDVDGDGLPDILLANGSPGASVKLYRNASAS